MIEPTIRARLLALPSEYRKAAGTIVGRLKKLALTKENRADREAVLGAKLAALWQDAKTNESIRKAQLEVVLRDDPTWSALDKVVQLTESEIKHQQIILDTLRFEASILIAVIPNDGALTVYGIKE